jgi:hypothetical protein
MPPNGLAERFAGLRAGHVISTEDAQAIDRVKDALHRWFKMQSVMNTSHLYNVAGELFGSDFNPFELDSVE